MINLNDIQSLVLYIFSFAISIMFASKLQKKALLRLTTNKISNLNILIVISIPLLLASFRYGVGTDYFNYEYIYYEYSSSSILSVLTSSDPMFGILNVLSALIIGNSWGVFFLSSLITLFVFMKALDYFKHDISFAFALLIYYSLLYGTSLNIVRQMIAVSLVLYSIKFIIERKPLKYLIGIIIATMFHFSAVFMLPIYLLGVKRIENYKFKQAYLYIVIVFSPILVYIILNWIDKLNITRFTSSYTFDFTQGGIGFLLWILPTLIPIFYFKKYVNNLYPKYQPLFMIYLLQIPLSYLGYYSLYGSRMMYFASIIEVVIVPLIIRCIPSKNTKVILSIYFIAWYIFKFIFEFYINGGGEIFPYRTIFR